MTTLHVILRDGFGTVVAAGDLTPTGAADPGQLKTWLTARESFPIRYSTPHPEFPLEMLVIFDD